MTLALTFTSNCFYYVCLQGSRTLPEFHKKEKILLPENYTIPETVAWFETQLELILDNLKPVSISYKLTINNITNNYVSCVYYGQGILNLLCHKKGIQISHTAPSAIVPSKFNQPKGSNLHNYLDNLIGIHPPHWDKVMKDTALIALIQLS
jgi:hypothetical protein